MDPSKQSKIHFALLLTLFFAVVEYTTGIMFNSLALVADAGHMFTDSIALLVASIAAYIARRGANERYTYGFSKVEIAAALINLALIVFIIVEIAVKTVDRVGATVEIDGLGVLSIAFVGLVINIGVFWLLHHGTENFNTRAAKMHVMGDILGSVAAIVSGACILLFGWMFMDPVMSGLVCLLLAKMAWGLGKEILVYLLDAVPEELCIAEIEKTILSLDDSLVSVHDLHVWRLSGKEISLTAHVDVKTFNNWNDLLFKINTVLLEKGIAHVTIQPEWEGGYCSIEESA
jgi:cobalt-zinc-cadmium efflux system protein